MRALQQIALVAAIMAIPSAGYSQDRGLVDGKVGADSQSSLTALPGSSAPLERNNPYGAPPRAPQERPGFAGTVAPGQVISRDTPIEAQSGGTGTAVVNGQRVQVDANTRRIIRAF